MVCGFIRLLLTGRTWRESGNRSRRIDIHGIRRRLRREIDDRMMDPVRLFRLTSRDKVIMDRIRMVRRLSSDSSDQDART